MIKKIVNKVFALFKAANVSSSLYPEEYQIPWEILNTKKDYSQETWTYEEDNHIEIHPLSKGKVDVVIKGKYNIVKIGVVKIDSEKLRIVVGGNHNHISIGNIHTGRRLSLVVGIANSPLYTPIKNCTVEIGNCCWFGECEIRTVNSGTKLIIEDGVVCSKRVIILHTDNHPIFDRETKKIINSVSNLYIGKHVWIGDDVRIMKNCCIPGGAIIAASSVLTASASRKMEPCCIVAGNPAKIVRKNIDFSMDGSKGYCENNQ